MRVAVLARRTWATAQQSSHLSASLEWWRAYYHFVRPHESLRVALLQPHERGGNRLAQRYRATDTSHGSRHYYPTMDGARGTFVPFAKGLRLRGIKARGRRRVMSH